MTLTSNNSLKINESCGGRDRTRTCDLLRVKPTAGFFRLQGVPSVLWLFNNMGRLLFAQRQVPSLERIAF
jgi:hypothetical protein